MHEKYETLSRHREREKQFFHLLLFVSQIRQGANFPTYHIGRTRRGIVCPPLYMVHRATSFNTLSDILCSRMLSKNKRGWEREWVRVLFASSASLLSGRTFPPSIAVRKAFFESDTRRGTFASLESRLKPECRRRRFFLSLIHPSNVVVVETPFGLTYLWLRKAQSSAKSTTTQITAVRSQLKSRSASERESLRKNSSNRGLVDGGKFSPLPTLFFFRHHYYKNRHLSNGWVNTKSVWEKEKF